MNLFDSTGFFQHVLFESFGSEQQLINSRLIAAGTLNQGIYLETSNQRFFLKTNFSTYHDIFEREASGLMKMRLYAPDLKVPEIFAYGNVEGQNYLLMEWIDSERRQPDFWRVLGEGLAQLHMNTRPSFGLDEDNYIASLSQINDPKKTWADFYVENRLEPLAGKAYYEGFLSLEFYKNFQQLYPLIGELLPVERPAFLHGDLWSGNVMIDSTGKPCLIDPAVYYGHREMDIAFSKLFGGFDPAFYETYFDFFPLEPGFDQRVEIHQLYPLLVHVLLFGESYVSGIAKTLRKFLT
ncbi:fructosamine kinase family protein [Mongoliitalea daihaiensis]|uniref:fructosamine kinase family protein n=1 Tax=Mongoliitalea daihaiensis TaxID=2782006 RepID=UPI001F424980|nr:fructosamine kinase family protein [Mongoliitalea daihaiensis]UJP66659.1 fructosamine kinase family protein [Mongoliitalea daihaiensis]